MALPPTDNASAPPAPDASFPPGQTASACGFNPGLPKFNFGFKLPSGGIQIPPALPNIPIPLKLSCDPTKPVDVTSALKLPFGGGRPNNAPPDPDLDDST